jgi:15-cis-phytoene synthase
MMAKAPSSNPFDHAQAMVVRFEPDRHIAALFAPADRRAYLYALHAFALEVGGVRAAVKDPQLGEIRLQWWRDVVEGRRDEEAWGNPVAAALLRAIADNNLPAAGLTALIDARVADLYDDAPPDWTALEGYCGETQSSLIRLGGIILARGDDPGGADAAGHAGVAWGITGILRAFPWHARRGQIYMPQRLLDAVGVDREAIVAGRDGEGLRAALAEMRARARDHLAKARSLGSTIRPDIRAAFLPLAMVERYLQPMDGRKYKPFETIVDATNALRVWAMWRGW